MITNYKLFLVFVTIVLHKKIKNFLPPPERVKNDSLDISISNGWYQKDWCEAYLKYIDNLKTKERKIIYYDLSGNIKQVITFFPNERIGREFFF
ncbi:hypothetical protein HMPREF9072_00837 [Capnocytophaga sp. oral taxon 324 str. F0483]|nr:hypothetical protein HMPREF9072_00837 [Capnocytophaga sp. oral taxon 324 str. F0483]